MSSRPAALLLFLGAMLPFAAFGQEDTRTPEERRQALSNSIMQHPGQLGALAPENLLDRSYICIISGNEHRPEQWLVMHDTFPGVSGARRFVDALPPSLAQYQPYIRNLDDVACAE